MVLASPPRPPVDPDDVNTLTRKIFNIRGVGDNFADYWCFLLISHVILKYFQSNFYLNKLQLNVNKNMLELEVFKRI